MKSSGSPFPLDQTGIICFNRCPYLRSFISNICTEVLRSNTLPAQWTKAATILIHKKGDPSLPENFRPITLEPVSLKIFTSLLRNRVFTYLINNQYIESHYQKGFMPGMSGTLWAYNRNESHHKSFKKTTTECNHYLDRPKKRFWRSSPLINSICFTLSLHIITFHYIHEINCIAKILYNDFHLSIITNDFHTKYIAVEKGVLQGDWFSPLIFNLIINIFIQCVKEEKFTNFRCRAFKGFLLSNWFQFAGDAVAVTSLEGEN